MKGASNSMKDSNPLAFQQSLTFADLLVPYLSPPQRQALLRYRLAYHVMVKDTAGVKQAGPQLVSELMDIPLDSIAAENDRRYHETMEPFWSGTMDSTKIEGFQEEKQFALNLYAREICSYLYKASNAYAASLAANDPALHEELAWAVRCDELIPKSPVFQRLTAQLRQRISNYSIDLR
ncbi:hypothetical protein [Parapedobacter tibetensis]|uniref:hypothetical protein n=1 Tax=Parapedobacter tibetensis TaxID=2972951 RepID=UPI00214D7C10|nr:hypothetical protein [Parapedobacter tibetensis]